MNIYLFDENRIITFELPVKRIGNFWLKDENNKNVVNIYAESGQWRLKPSKISEITDDQGNTENIVLQPKKFYGVKINDKKFLMMSDYFSDTSFNYFTVQPNTIINIGSADNNNNIVMPLSCVNQEHASLENKENQWILNIKNN